LLVSALAGAQQVQWTRTFGGSDPIFRVNAGAIVTDATGLYVVGGVEGTLPGQHGPGHDAYIRKYDFDGRLLWTRQFDVLDGEDALTAVAIDATGLYVAGAGEDTQAIFRGFVARLDSAGRVVWSHTLSRINAASSIALHPSGVYVGGAKYGPVQDAAVTRLDRDGNEVWTALPADGAPTSTFVYNLAIDDTGIYVTGSIGTADVLRLGFDGNVIARFANGADAGGMGLALDASGIYVDGYDGTFGDYVVRKYARDTSLLWTRKTTHRASSRSLATDSTGLYAVSVVFDPPRGYSTMVSKLTLGGSELWSHDLPLYSGGPVVTVKDGQVFIASAVLVPDPGCPSCNRTGAYLAKLSQDLPAQLQSLQPEALAVLRHDSAANTVTALVKEASTGGLIQRIAFDKNFWPRQLVRVPDLNGNGFDELAVLGTHRISGRNAVEVRDGGTGATLARITFDRNFVAGRLVAMPDINGNGTPDLALLEASDDSGIAVPVPVRVEVRDGVSSALIRTIDLADIRGIPGWMQLAVLPDSNGNGVPELAVLGAPSFYPYAVEVRDALTADAIGRIGLPDAVTPLLSALTDSNGNRVAELAVLTPDRFGAVHAFVFDANGDLPVPLRTLPFNRVGEPREMSGVADLNGNGAPELAVLRANSAPDQSIVQIKDSLTGARVRSFVFPSGGLANRGLAVVPDIDGNAKPEVAVLQQRKSDGALQVRIHDAASGAFIRSIGF
jgi:hypothetical protein